MICSYRVSLAVMICLLCVTGCIPSETPKAEVPPVPEAPAPVAAPAVSETPLATPAPRSTSPSDLIPEMGAMAPVSPSATAPSGSSSRISGNLDNTPSAEDVGATVTSMVNGAGFTVAGSYGLKGTITRTAPDSAEWSFTGSFSFDTTGYQVGEPFVAQMMDIVVGDGPARFETEADSYVISIPVSRPRANAPAEPNTTKIPVQATIRAGALPQFTVVLVVK